MSLCLVGDIGGTNGRFAVYDGKALTLYKSFPCVNFSSFEALLDHYLNEIGGLEVGEAVFAIATHVSHDTVEFTNLNWTFSVSELAVKNGFNSLKVINDFTAVSLLVPQLRSDQLVSIGNIEHNDSSEAKAVIGAGTGLGVSGLLNQSGVWVPLQGQGGHVICGPANDFENALFAYISRQFDYISAENLLSGRGIALLYSAVLSVNGNKKKYTSVPDIVTAGIQGDDKDCELTLTVFSRIFGRVAGDLALTLGARGGVYLGGGVVNHLLDFIVTREDFREGFEYKGVMRSYMGNNPYVCYFRT